MSLDVSHDNVIVIQTEVWIALLLQLAYLEIIKVTTCELLSEHLNTSLRSMRMFIDTYFSLLLIDREVMPFKPISQRQFLLYPLFFLSHLPFHQLSPWISTCVSPWSVLSIHKTTDQDTLDDYLQGTAVILYFIFVFLHKIDNVTLTYVNGLPWQESIFPIHLKFDFFLSIFSGNKRKQDLV